MTTSEQTKRPLPGLSSETGAGLSPAPNAPAPVVEEELDLKSERFYYAKQWELIWWRFRRHQLAMLSLVLLTLLYLIAIFPEFTEPYGSQ